MEQYIAGEQPLLRNDGSQTTMAEAMAPENVKLVALYFSMHDCAPCQEFTPVFAQLYQEVNEQEKVMEVVFMSGDKTQDKFDAYFATQPWLAVPRGSDVVRTAA